ncbi:prephenate dehydratase [Desmospora profundinema]|uniref:Prephenate dehydratase n=1 Tax=Desmospora profundinema TaxID=1571184 RepID=A0ABU1IQH1_9BACL|nr:prephenate dehydratase [Desmospora profundinema]MDR6226389.1 prephenate dehydratase [Desmospora profundinema]
MKEPVAYLGPRGTFTHEAARRMFPEEHYLLHPCDSIPDVLTAVDSGETPYGVVPVENAIEGSVTLTLDWLTHHVDVPITAEVVVPIDQCLFCHPDHKETELSRFTRILSHPQAVAQCREYLRQHVPDAVVSYVDSTADAARRVGSQGRDRWLAIGPRSAGALYGLYQRDAAIQDYENNITRFIAVGKTVPERKQPRCRKTSLLLSLPEDYPGALYNVLASFVRQGINLSRLESRPTKKRLGTYRFFIDAEKEIDDLAMKQAMDEIRDRGCTVRLLGSYPCFSGESSNSSESLDNRDHGAYNHR